MKKHLILFAVLVVVGFSSCTKAIENIKDRIGNNPSTDFVQHNIARGQHNSDKNAYKPVTTPEMKFAVKFDNSAVYQTVESYNQGDINKLYGFSDNNGDHHTNSARIGWRWFQNQLQLFAYVYNNTVETNQLITSVPLNQEINCSIQTDGPTYVFTVNGTQVIMPRVSTTEQAIGYQLYPYFGGDEVAPQDIKIWIKDL